MRSVIPGGLLVAIEGIDGCGKSSLALSLAQYCGEHGVRCVVSKEPTSVGPGAELRKSAATGRLSLEQEYSYFLADRAAHVERTIKPALAEGSIVLLDRYYWSTAAYQGIRGMDPLAILADNERFAPRPHGVLLLDLTPEAGLTLIRKRGDVPNTFEALNDLMRIREVFLHVHAATTYGHIVDATVPLRDVQTAALHIFLSIARQAAGPAAEAEREFFQIPKPVE